MGRKKKPRPDDPEQYARFVETAKKIEADDAKERFEEAMKRILSAKQKVKRENDENYSKPDELL